MQAWHLGILASIMDVVRKREDCGISSIDMTYVCVISKLSVDALQLSVSRCVEQGDSGEALRSLCIVNPGSV